MVHVQIGGNDIYGIPVSAFVAAKGKLVAYIAVCWLEGEESSWPQTQGEGEG